LAGVVTGIEFMKRLRERRPQPKYTYRLLILPETFGSAVYCANHTDDLDNSIGAVFTEMPGAVSDLQFVHSRRGDTYIDRVFRHVLKVHGKPTRLCAFRGGWGNDELMFDSAGLGTPAISLDRYPFPEYHTHHDDITRFHPDKLDEIVELFLRAVDIIERDFIPRPVNRVPVYLTRHDLYNDWTWERSQYDFNARIIDSMWSNRSIFDIAIENGLDVELALDYADRFVDHGLVNREAIGPAYARDVRFLSNFAVA
jgi:aminopeptidase-like protein